MRLSWWFPRIEAAGVPVPRTKLLKMPPAAREDIYAMFDGKDVKDGMPAFADEVRAAAAEFGYPFFLRTDYTSGKHNWANTCFVGSPEDVLLHIFNIVEFSECAAFIGLPWTNWAVREMLPIMPISICKAYGNMPVCREFRFFVDGGKVQCWHTYWRLHALEQGSINVNSVDAFRLLSRMDRRDEDRLVALAEQAGRAVGGAWSVDVLDTARGWFVTDMAEAHKSYHWGGCALGLESP